MSLDILLLAAEFLEWRSKTKTRGNDIATDFSIYVEQLQTSLNSASASSLPPLLPPLTLSPPTEPPPSLLVSSPPHPPSPKPSASALQPLPEEPATSTSSPPSSFLPQATAPQSPHGSNNSNSNIDLTFKNAEKNDKRRSGGAGTREVHNKLEKNRRAHMKEMFEYLRSQIPQLEDKKNSNLSILRNAIRYIQTLRRKEKEQEVEVQKLAQNKISLREKLRLLKMDPSLMSIECSLKDEPDTEDEEDMYSTSTASEGDGPIMSDVEEEKIRDPPKENPPQLKVERKAPPIITGQALPTVIGAAPAQLTFASTSSVMSTTTLLPGSIKPFKNNISFPGGPPPSGPTTLIANNTMSASNIIHNNNTHTNISPTTQRPVMEILYKTLAQRQALNKPLFGNSTGNTRPDIISATVNTVQSSKMFQTTTPLNPQNSIRSVIPLPTTSVKPGLQSTGIKLATLTIPVNKPTKMAITPHKKIVVDTSPASASPGVSVTHASSLSSSSSSSSSSFSSTSVSGSSTSALTAIVRTPVAPHPIVSQTVPVMSAVKQIITNPAGSPLTVNPLLGQSLSRAQILNPSMLPSQPMSSSSTTTSSNQISSVHPVVSLTPVSQLVSPAVHVSPGLQQATQLNMFPIIQSQLFPTNQVVGQSVTAKPLVMVTVPTTTTVQVSVAITPTTT